MESRENFDNYLHQLLMNTDNFYKGLDEEEQIDFKEEYKKTLQGVLMANKFYVKGAGRRFIRFIKSFF